MQSSKNNIRRSGAAAGLGLLAALIIAINPTAAGMAQSSQFGAYPEMSMEQTLPIIGRALRDHLLDAGSVTNSVACYPPVKVKLKEGRPVRWTGMFSLNAKNSYGGYTGAQQMAAVFQLNKLVEIISTGMPPGLRDFGTCTRVPDAEMRQLIEPQ